MSTHISGFEDVSKERKSKVWINMLFHKEKGLALITYRSTFYHKTVWVLHYPWVPEF